MTRTTQLLGCLSMATCFAASPAFAADDTGLFDWDTYEGADTTSDSSSSSSGSTDISDAETSFKGALMLKGDVDVSIGDLTAGIVEDDENFRYAFFSGNTLYAGVEDRHGNTADMIVEFFWFESSIDRGSDFWVAVVKARTTPNLEEGWKLEVEEEPVLSLHAETYNEMENAGFRWDWSLPFESYGWDAYGSVTMESSYGLNTNAEGAAMVAYEQKESAEGVTEEVSATVQAKGYMNDSFQIQTKYQITLWRWEMMVQGTPADMDWDLYLDSWDRQDQNAYHEFMVVMQADEDQGFSLERLELSGNTTDPRWYWWDAHSTMSLAIHDIHLARPDIDLEDYQTDDWLNDDDESGEGDTESNGDGDSEDMSNPGDDTENNDETGDTTNITVQAPADGGCSTTGNRNTPLGLVLALGMVAMGRRRDD